MRINILGKPNHNVYSVLGENLRVGLEEIGHTVSSDYSDLVITIQTTHSWNEIKDLPGKKMLYCHGVNYNAYARGTTEDEKTLRKLRENCDYIVYSSHFAKYMAEKYLGKKDGAIILNTTIPDFPNNSPEWKPGETIKIATCSYPRALKRVYQMVRLVKALNNKGYKIELHVVGGYTDKYARITGEPIDGDDYSFYYDHGILNRDKLKNLFQNCHCTLQFGFNDFSPATVGESMAWGTPVISTNSGGSKDIIGNAGIIIDSDPFIDSAFPINREDLLPQISVEQFEKALLRIMDNLADYQNKVRQRVLQEANIITQMEKLLNHYVEGRYVELQESRGMTGSATSEELTPWIQRFIDNHSQYIQEPILDIGGGDGNFVNWCKTQNKFAVEVDISKLSVKKAIENKISAFLYDVQYGLPFPEKTFRTITLFHSLEHFLFPVKALNHIYRVLNGTLCIIVPNQICHGETHGHFTYFESIEKLKNFLTKHGWEIILTEDWKSMFLIIAKNG